MTKVLLDTCVWGGTKTRLIELGFDVVWSGDWDFDPGDLAILSRAHADRRILITLDKDFGELAIVRQISHSGIIRLVGFPVRSQADACSNVLINHEALLMAGGILTVTPQRIRIRSSSD